MEQQRCTGCDGTGVIQVRIQHTIRGKRMCVDQVEECPVCLGTCFATQADIDAFFKDILGEE